MCREMACQMALIGKTGCCRGFRQRHAACNHDLGPAEPLANLEVVRRRAERGAEMAGLADYAQAALGRPVRIGRSPQRLNPPTAVLGTEQRRSMDGQENCLRSVKGYIVTKVELSLVMRAAC